MEQEHEPRIAVYLDYENLAIGARENRESRSTLPMLRMRSLSVAA